ncbi:RbsD/FucU domain-containing protein [Shigella flexneri]
MISPLISPSPKVLAEMGHGDEIIFSHGPFPADSMGHRLFAPMGSKVSDLLQAVIPLFELSEPRPPSGEDHGAAER